MINKYIDKINKNLKTVLKKRINEVNESEEKEDLKVCFKVVFLDPEYQAIKR